MKQSGINGLYAVTPDILDTAVLLDKVCAVLRGGAKVLQYRNKLADSQLRQQQAIALRSLTRAYGATFIINDDVSLALCAEADGVHLGADDGEISWARAQLGAGKLIGASCYNQAELARRAVAQGADYVAFGAFYPSSVKPGAVRADMKLLSAMRDELAVPLVAIGGITLANGRVLVDAGADALAVISSVFAAADVEVAAREFSKLFLQEAEA